MAAGEAFSPAQKEQINRAIAIAERQSGFRFAVYVEGASNQAGNSRETARAIHRGIPGRSGAVLVYVDPSGRAVEIVTGAEARRDLDDRACSLAAVAMTSTFAAGDLAGGIVDGLRILGEHARHSPVLHRTLGG